MKKLLALLVAGGLLALTTGCPPGTTSEEKKTTTTTTTTTTETKVNGTAKDDATADKVTVTGSDKKDTDVMLTKDTTFSGDAKAATDIKKGWSVEATVKDGKATAVKGTKPAA